MLPPPLPGRWLLTKPPSDTARLCSSHATQRQQQQQATHTKQVALCFASITTGAHR
jgi:hypothetical protein